jgi:hypothetical protein
MAQPCLVYPENLKRKNKMIEMNISDILQKYLPSEKDFPMELKEHIASSCDILLSDQLIWLINQVYAETKYRVIVEITEKLKEI